MVTASHNPAQYNGFKLCKGMDSIHGEQIQTILQIIEAGDFAKGQGDRSSADAISPYRAFLKENIRLDNPLRIGVDAGNGTAGVVAVPTMQALGCEVYPLYCEMDGTFPNHEADPTVLAPLLGRNAQRPSESDGNTPVVDLAHIKRRAHPMRPLTRSPVVCAIGVLMLAGCGLMLWGFVGALTSLLLGIGAVLLILRRVPRGS